MNELPFTPPFRVLSHYKCGTDAHIVDAAKNILLECSQWVDGELRHKEAMHLICNALNKAFPKTEENNNMKKVKVMNEALEIERDKL